MVHEQKIRVWMLKKGIRVQDVANGAGVHHSYVSHFLAGRKKAPAVRAWFVGRGCPAKFLDSEKKEARDA
ncbi:hypothetical protein [Solidesulfovibrio sp.]